MTAAKNKIKPEMEARKKSAVTLKARFQLDLEPHNLRAIEVYDKDSNYINTYKSKKEAAKVLKVRENGIKKCLAKTYSQHRGYRFIYTGEEKPIAIN
jgi:hypothetical protein